MVSWIRMFVEWLLPERSRKWFRLDRIFAEIERTGNIYLDKRIWASIRGIDEEAALSELRDGARMGFFVSCWLYEWSDTPVRLVVPHEYAGRTVSLAEFGLIEEEDREIELAPTRLREVFVNAAQESREQ